MAQWLWKPIDNACTLLANSAKFQEVVGADSAAEALLSIHRADSLDDETHPMPRATVGPMPDRSLRRVATGPGGWTFSGDLFVLLEFTTPDNLINDFNGQFDWFQLLVETIIEQMAVLAGSGTYLNVREFVEACPAYPAKEKLNNGKHYWFTEWALRLSE